MKGLSRMRGNSHVRFLGEGLAVMPSSYPIRPLRISISKINAAFLTGQQIDRIHVQQLLLPSFMCQGAQRLLLYHVPSQKTIAFLTKDTHKNFPP